MSNIDNYIPMATRTESLKPAVIINKDRLERLLYAYIQIGNVLDTVKKHVFYNKPLDIKTQNQRVSSAMNALGQLLGDEFDENPSELSIDPRLFHSIVGIATEGTELVEAVYKSEFNNQAIDDVNVREELFDVLWYLLTAHDKMNVSVEGTLNMGFDKLRARFPDKFTDDAAINRDVDAERRILEQHN